MCATTDANKVFAFYSKDRKKQLKAIMLQAKQVCTCREAVVSCWNKWASAGFACNVDWTQ